MTPTDKWLKADPARRMFICSMTGFFLATTSDGNGLCTGTGATAAKAVAAAIKNHKAMGSAAGKTPSSPTTAGPKEPAPSQRGLAAEGMQ